MPACQKNHHTHWDHTGWSYWRPIIGCHGSKGCLPCSGTLDWRNILQKMQKLQNQQINQIQQLQAEEMGGWWCKGMNTHQVSNWQFRNDPHQWCWQHERNVGSAHHGQGIQRPAQSSCNPPCTLQDDCQRRIWYGGAYIKTTGGVTFNGKQGTWWGFHDDSHYITTWELALIYLCLPRHQAVITQ